MKAPILLALAGLSIAPAQAVEPTGTLTLACQGTITDGNSEDAKPEPTARGIIVNFAKRTVQGFDNDMAVPAEVMSVNDVIVVFGGSRTWGDTSMSIHGTIDRVTGNLEASETNYDTRHSKFTVVTNYLLKSKPTQRIF
jgi:hypothetical protein